MLFERTQESEEYSRYESSCGNYVVSQFLYKPGPDGKFIREPHWMAFYLSQWVTGEDAEFPSKYAAIQACENHKRKMREKFGV